MLTDLTGKITFGHITVANIVCATPTFFEHELNKYNNAIRQHNDNYIIATLTCRIQNVDMCVLHSGSWRLNNNDRYSPSLSW